MMDCVVVDVTSLPSVRLGDEAVVIGKSGRNDISAVEVAEWCDSSPYEVFCSLDRRVRRIYTRGGKRIIPRDTAAERERVDGSARVPDPLPPLTP